MSYGGVRTDHDRSSAWPAIVGLYVVSVVAGGLGVLLESDGEAPFLVVLGLWLIGGTLSSIATIAAGVSVALAGR